MPAAGDGAPISTNVSVPGAAEPAGRTIPDFGAKQRTRRRRVLMVLVPLAAIVAAGLIAAALIRIPYYALGPGSVRATEPLIDLGGAERDPRAGTVDFATVSVNGRVNLLEAFAGWIDPAVDVVPEERILQGRTPKENQQVNLQLMDDSKSVAVQVALQRVGLSKPTGAEIAQVSPGSPAEGVLGAGDVVSAIGDLPVVTSSELVAEIRKRAAGEAVELSVRPAVEGKAVTDPNGTTVRRTVTLGASPEQPSVAFLGVSVRTAYQVDFPHEVTIDSGQVGGPSAGLAFTLGVIDLLTPGDLTGGTEVTATGTIRPDGSVGAIGGVQQKAAAVRRAGVKLFLVPAEQTPEELARARDLAGSSVDIVPVRTLDEALDVLATRGGGSVALPRT